MYDLSELSLCCNCDKTLTELTRSEGRTCNYCSDDTICSHCSACINCDGCPDCRSYNGDWSKYNSQHYCGDFIGKNKFVICNKCENVCCKTCAKYILGDTCYFCDRGW